MTIQLPVEIQRQPDYTTCGPTSLQAIYAFYGDPITLTEVIDQIDKVPGGGTVSIHLAVHALRRGYEADIWACNVNHMDPTWFQHGTDIGAKLRARAEGRRMLDDPRYGAMVKAVEEFQRLGGRYHWGDLTPRRIGDVLKRGFPILAGTNGTYLYQCVRETADGEDDVLGDPFGHFVVVCGYDSARGKVQIADPLKDNPLTGRKYYEVTIHRLLGAIFLGTSSDDGNLLVIHPRA